MHTLGVCIIGGAVKAKFCSNCTSFFNYELCFGSLLNSIFTCKKVCDDALIFHKFLPNQDRKQSIKTKTIGPLFSL